MLFRAGGPKNFEDLAGHKIGVRAGTTTETALGITLEDLALNAQVVAVSNHDDGLRKLEANEISAYFADQAILIFLLNKSETPKELRVSKRFFTYEPYAVGLARGDSAFRLAVDRALSRIYRSGTITSIFVKNFGAGTPSNFVEALYLISALPE